MLTQFQNLKTCNFWKKEDIIPYSRLILNLKESLLWPFIPFLDNIAQWTELKTSNINLYDGIKPNEEKLIFIIIYKMLNIEQNFNMASTDIDTVIRKFKSKFSSELEIRKQWKDSWIMNKDWELTTSLINDWFNKNKWELANIKLTAWQ